MNEREHVELVRLREAFSSGPWDVSTEGCPDSGTLWASAAGELDAAENEGVLLHLARCRQCATGWQLAREMISPGETGGERVLSLEKGRRSRIWRRPTLLAAAATVLIGLGLGTGLLLQNRRVAPQPVYRQQQPTFEIVASPETQHLAPSGCRLRWNAGPAGIRYDLTVTTDDLGVLAVVKGLTAPEYLVPAEEIPKSTREILWRVTAHLPGGDTLRSGTFRSRIVN